MQNANSYFNSHAGCQKERVPEEGEISMFRTIFHFLRALQAFSMTDSLCTHGKDKPGLVAEFETKNPTILIHNVLTLMRKRRLYRSLFE